MILKNHLLTLALTTAFMLLIPQTASAQSFAAREDHTSYDGTRLTYYQRPDFAQCQADCANNANCQGFTWIQAGTYNPRDPAMCYLLSAVTRRYPARGHYSAIKGSGGGGASLGAREDNVYLNGTRLTYYQRPDFAQCQADCANNANCQGFTWIQAGTYNAGDPAMCYLFSAVTGRASARGHYSAVKGAAGGGGGGCRGTSYSVTVNPSTASSGEKVQAQLASPDGNYPKDSWVGLFPEGGSGHLGQWSYMRDLPNCARTFSPPNPGKYEIRLFLDGGYDKVGARGYFTVR